MRSGRTKRCSLPWCWKGEWSPWTPCCASGTSPRRSGLRGALRDGGQGEPEGTSPEDRDAAFVPSGFAGSDPQGGGEGGRSRPDRAAGAGLQRGAVGEESVSRTGADLPAGARAGYEEDGEATGGGGVWDQQLIGKGSRTRGAVEAAARGMEDREPI